MNIQEFHVPEPGNTLEAIEKTTPEMPAWINVDHPEFPRYFIISLLDKKGEVTHWWQSLPV
ncbi:MAG: hypothetical protein V7K50_23180 [Nostoc sp.]|uniref:hypothetical protein n=1 Tax=Nostoc sp. TaxID=1180 RepID=UPI002FF4A381